MTRLFFCLLVLSGLAITVSAAPADSMPGMSGDSMPGMTAKPAPTAAPGSGTKGAAHGAAQPAPAQPTPVQRPSVQPVAAMPAMSADTSGPWKTAAFALVAIILVGAIVIRRDHRATTIALVVGAAVFVVTLAVLQQRFAAPAMDMSTMSDTKGVGPLPVTLATVGAANGRQDISATGTIAPYLTQDIVARTSGLLRSVTFYTGDRVAAGTVLATLDAPDLQTRAQTAVADAEAQSASAAAAQVAAFHHVPLAARAAHDDIASLESSLAAARADREAKAEQRRYWDRELVRERGLLDAGAVSRQEYEDERTQAAAARAAFTAASAMVASQGSQIDAARTRAATADAAIEEARQTSRSADAGARRAASEARTQAILAGYQNVIAPNDGIIIKRLIDPGVLVQAGTPIARLAVIDRLRIAANVAQSDLAGIAVGTALDVTAAGRTYRGRVTSVSPVVDATTRTATVEAVVDNPGSALVPGGFARITIHRTSRSGAGLQIPSAAIVGGGGDAAVWADVNGTAHRVPVTLISDNGTAATVTAGELAVATKIVLEGASTLEEGQSIVEAPRS
jgi:RND family efflux transporter MFP subunit